MSETIKFNKQKTIDYWVSGSKYDLDIINALFEKKKYPYALFFGHLALEKLLKGLFVKETGQHTPYTHSLPMLAGKLSLNIPDDIKESLVDFMEFHIEARYPEIKNMFYHKCTRKYAQDNIAEVKRIYKWLEKQL